MPTRYMATLEGNQHELEISEISAHEFRVKLGGTEHQLDVRQVGSGSFSILISDRCFDVDVVRDGDELIVALRGRSSRVTLVDAARHAHRVANSERPEFTGRAEVKALMPGRIVNVLVNPGDEVSQQQGVIIVEAMKMENELKSPKAGKIAEIKVIPGQTVEKGELLVVIE
jgi:biotin carboxyl carrier protein